MALTADPYDNPSVPAMGLARKGTEMNASEQLWGHRATREEAHVARNLAAEASWTFAQWIRAEAHRSGKRADRRQAAAALRIARAAARVGYVGEEVAS